jgi:murein DD-endopeptidase MepM/ murein hydrolase activator NlpD
VDSAAVSTGRVGAACPVGREAHAHGVLRTLPCLAALVVWLLPGAAPARRAPLEPTTAAGRVTAVAAVRVHRAATSRAAVYYSAPVEPLAVVRSFAPPLTEYGPGHLGADLRAPGSGWVRAAGDGVVTFAGRVAGRGVVVLRHRDGMRTEYEPVVPFVVRGADVQRGQPIARVEGRHPGCSVACLHWGARRADTYVDPLALLHPLGPVRLLPWPRDG